MKPAKRRIACTWLLILMSFSPLAYNFLSAPRISSTPADLILRNGVVYTLAAARTWAEAVAIAQGRIVYVGPESGIGPWVGSHTAVINLQRKMVLPGFHDSHVHPLSGGIGLGECYLSDLTTQDQILEAVRHCAEQNPQKEWVRGGRWDLSIFPNANPHKSLLDKIVPGRPVYLEAADGHSAWVNSRALELAGITKQTLDPPHGRIERDPETGEPTGTLREYAMSLISEHLPDYTAEDGLKGLRRGLEMAARFGITSIQDAAADEGVLKAYAELDRRGELTVRAVAAMLADPDKGVAQIPRLLELKRDYHGHRLRANAVKIMLDGVIEAHTAALLDPYVGSSGNRGKANWEPAALNRLVSALDAEGFQIHVHAIGDRAVRMALDAFEHARAANGSRDSRHHIAHLELINPQDLPRFRRLGVIANFQPLWAYPDPYITKLTYPVLGPERSRWIYPIGSLVKTGATVACGSDWPVTSMNPVEAMQVAVTRVGLTEGPGAAWIPEELVDLPTIVSSYTINGAYVNFQETEAGSIEVGKAADLVVLDRNLFDIPAHEIHRAKVWLTLLEGKEVYRNPTLN
jgi:predicted amidohydrolase YtcJ